jgi:hypothetical protein
MERLMMLRVQAKGCAVEAHLNGMPVARLGPAGGVVTLPVHEYTLAGKNRMGFVAGILPDGKATEAPKPRVSRGDMGISLKLALCHQGQSPEDPNARTLSQLSWSPALNESHDWPFTFTQDMDLPVTFPRWRWLDAPPVAVSAALELQVLTLLQTLALDLQRGDPESYLQLCRLRTEELALAYQRTPQVCNQQLRDHFQKLFELGALATVLPPEPGSFQLRPLGQGRLVEPVLANGGPVLGTQPGDNPKIPQAWWPLRLAQVEGKLYALR